MPTTVPITIVVTITPVVAMPLLVILDLCHPMIAVRASVFRWQRVQYSRRGKSLRRRVGHRDGGAREFRSMQIVFYARVSTADQTISHQEKQARDAGFAIDRVVAEHGVSGVSTPLAERPEGRRLFDLLRAGDVLVVRWVDRLGRNYADVTESIRELMRRGVVIKTIINRMTFDGATADPMQQAVRDALIAFIAASAQAQAEATKAAQAAGIEHAKAGNGNAYRGRKPSFTPAQMKPYGTCWRRMRGSASSPGRRACPGRRSTG